MNKTLKTSLVVAILLLLGAGLGYAIATWRGTQDPAANGGATLSAVGDGRKVLYWYDPMVPQHKFDKPGKSPFMEMQLVPKYADEASAGGVAVDPRVAQTLGWRTATVEKQRIGSNTEAVATVQLNDRDVAAVQARSAGFVQQVGRIAPGDVIAQGALIAELLVPEWVAAQQEFLAVRATGDAALTNAARQRLSLLGMPAATIQQVEQSGRVQSAATVHAPIAGLVQELMVRPGMTVSQGMTLVRINGLATVWLEAALPETQAAAAKPGQPVEVRMSAFPGEAWQGKVTSILAQTNTDTRTLKVRIELPNPKGRLRAGMFAQVRFAVDEQEALVVPSDAVIRTGQRAVVYVVSAPGRYQPVEVRVGREFGDKLEVLQGLQPGQQVVVSGQFLIDSEASMQGVLQRQAPAASAASPASTAASSQAASASSPAQTTHEGTGKVIAVSTQEVTLDHGPIASIQWPAMQMPFKLARPELGRGLKAGDPVRFNFTQSGDAYVVQSIERAGAAK
ncbi:efflux RND transporter periplasmic adaptor subunit [Piscinibacter gummiphilus]|uniref:Efflux RND transporter periplasmic adaptor subunit n=1 Tax=Piscinibacter gummiphilus TaxID=946333 RepID=A0ABZ0D176_9BURK|nr:efflux RND transporter periplasmic adaptor subunit [Piscinibacter gummiphilus]WOB10922.1 efflux RND transporter periplasmic adaptor subunit [Piscinibacter gummiphilus]